MRFLRQRTELGDAQPAEDLNIYEDVYLDSYMIYCVAQCYQVYTQIYFQSVTIILVRMIVSLRNLE